MYDKLSFGIDYCLLMMKVSSFSQDEKGTYAIFASNLLSLEWGFSYSEWDNVTNQVGQVLSEMNGELDIYEVISRLAEYVKEIPDASAKLLTDVIMVFNLDGNIGDEKKSFVAYLASVLKEFNIPQYAQRADELLKTFAWFANNNPIYPLRES